MGRPLKIKNPEQLYKWFNDYKKQVKNNPILKMDYKGSKPKRVNYELERPLTWIGFKAYLYNNYGVTNIHQYRANRRAKYAPFAPIFSGIDSIITEDQLTGALVGMYSQNIVARKLSLSDKNQTDISVTKTTKTDVGFE